MEKFLVDRHEVLKAIVDTYFNFYHKEEVITSEETAVVNFAKEIIDTINALDAQKIEGIDLGKGDGKVSGN